MAAKLGIVTIGQAPRDDIAALFAAQAPAGTEEKRYTISDRGTAAVRAGAGAGARGADVGCVVGAAAVVAAGVGAGAGAGAATGAGAGSGAAAAGFGAGAAAGAEGGGEIAFTALWHDDDSLLMLRWRHCSASAPPGVTPEQFDM